LIDSTTINEEDITSALYYNYLSPEYVPNNDHDLKDNGLHKSPTMASG